MTRTTALPDWRERIIKGLSLIPHPPLFADEAAASMEVFDSLVLVDALGQPTLGEAARPWVRDFAAQIFGALNPETGVREIREFFLLISKKNGKSTGAAAIMLTELIRNERHSAEFLILAPTKEVADNSYTPARDMVKADPELDRLLHCKDHERTIRHRGTGAHLKVVAADSATVSGKKATGVLIDELWLFGKNAKADAMFREATGGQLSRPEGFTIYLTTQSDEPPSGVFKTKLNYFRNVRDGLISDPKSLGVLYEFPEEMVKNREYENPDHFHITNPNLGLSVSREYLEEEWIKVRGADDGSKQVFLAKHLNVEIGLALRNDAWVGARYWLNAADRSLTLETLMERSEVAVVGVDGGGLDDLMGLAVIGRDKETRDWLLWCHAWAHSTVLQRRKDIVSRLQDFAAEGSLTICDEPTQDIVEAADIVERLNTAGLLPEKAAVGLDPIGVTAMLDEMAERGIADEQMQAVLQGYRLNGAVLGTERKLNDGTLRHDGSELMAWCVGNARVERRGNAVLITKQISGAAKIDPLMAAFNAVMLMSRNPEGNGSTDQWLEAVAA
ncbi:terminase large subunit [Erythrobacteraceae bacterium CFH 75059]|uniref:terminase large subunit n=1 Tax=Qipengyuania thermophila TaxID=2509361 RepID=UPI00101FA0D1|nr:terminase TerL endonuclease subunit [Qipengyuania thermophila]TCD04267.1 terminase large subunit [Erythrobacteraceae bacterium CFH 75059]